MVRSDITISKDEQVHDYLLCANCEHLFNQNGEGWVLQHCHRNGDFELRRKLNEEPPHVDNGKFRCWAAAKIPSIDVAQLSYFASSIFWRASVHDWKSGSRPLGLPQLGLKYDEEFRLYLLGKGPFPALATMSVGLLDGSDYLNGILFPHGGKIDGYWRYDFVFLGLVFTLFLGNLVPAGTRSFCLNHSKEHFIAQSKMINEMMLQHAEPLLQKSRPVGTLKKRVK